MNKASQSGGASPCMRQGEAGAPFPGQNVRVPSELKCTPRRSTDARTIHAIRAIVHAEQGNRSAPAPNDIRGALSRYRVHGTPKNGIWIVAVDASLKDE